jgi:hypothetical protein
MFVTPLGSFDGTSWDNIIQVIHKRKYMEVGYQPIKASPGDYGLEGFTKDGLAFQCYCPDYNVDSTKLYELQRDKKKDQEDKPKEKKQEPKMNKQQMENELNKLRNEEKRLQQDLQKQKVKQPSSPEKDW